MKLTSSRIVAWMAAVIAALGLLAYWDERHEADAALADFALEQAAVAKAAAASLRDVSADALAPEGPVPFRDATSRLRVVEHPGEVLVLLHRDGDPSLYTLDGDVRASAPNAARFAGRTSAASWVRLSHEESAALGLPLRTGVAGFAEVDSHDRKPWSVVVVSTARRERDREERGLWRVGMGFLVTSAITVTFGSLALRKQRKEAELAQRLAISEAVRERDERLVRADKLATFGAIATGIAHQLATPLGVIVGRAERLAPRVASDEKASRAVSVIADQAERINQIVRGFHRLARGASPALEHVPPSVIARTAIDLVAHRFEQAHVSLDLFVAEDLPLIACDAKLFEQVLVNLLLNGCDACDRGGRVALRVERGERFVVFAIEDDGAGITETTAERAQEPFFTTKASGEGMGLGLAIASEIVNHHHGSLTLEPRRPHGTRAAVQIPALTAGAS